MCNRVKQARIRSRYLRIVILVLKGDAEFWMVPKIRHKGGPLAGDAL